MLAATVESAMSPLTYFALVLVLGIAGQWIAWRAKLPSILLLLLFGFALSYFTGEKIDSFLPEGTLLAIVGIFVAIILFEGGLTLKFSELKESGNPVLRICTIGVVIAFLMTTYAAKWILGLDIRLAALVGAILIVTGPTVVAPLLRLIKPSRKISSILKWEGIVIDPVGAILAVLVFQLAIAGGFKEARGTMLIALGKTLLVGVGFAWILGKAIVYLLKKHWIPDYLESVFMLAIVAGCFAISNAFQTESGLLTVTILGIVIANQKDVPVKHILEFKEHLRVLIISLLFVILSGRIELKTLGEVLAKGGLFLLALIILIRPASILLANLFSSKISFKEQLFVSTVAPRGIVAAAVTSIFALEVEHAAKEGQLSPALAEQATTLVPIVFIVIIGTVAIYGLMAVPLAKLLGISSPNPRGVVFAGADEISRMIAKTLHDEGHQVLLLDTQYDKVAQATLEGLPAIRANILSEYAEEEIDFAGIGQLIASTPNDGVNTLATKEFAHLFGRVNVWQLTPHDKDTHHSKAVASHMQGRHCYSQSPTFQDLERKVYQGHKIKKTTITDVFTLEDFHQVYGKDAPILFLDDASKGLRPAEADLVEIPAETIIYALVEPTENGKMTA